MVSLTAAGAVIVPSCCARCYRAVVEAVQMEPFQSPQAVEALLLLIRKYIETMSGPQRHRDQGTESSLCSQLYPVVDGALFTFFGLSITLRSRFLFESADAGSALCRPSRHY